MAIVEWDDSYSVNVKIIDKQHQRLFAMINELDESVTSGKDETKIGKYLNELVEYLFTHFRTEEEYFEEFNYPELDYHLKEHLDFTKKVVEFRRGYEQGEMQLAAKVVEYLKEWITDHIMKTDMLYKPFFEEKGIR